MRTSGSTLESADSHFLQTNFVITASLTSAAPVRTDWPPLVLVDLSFDSEEKFSTVACPRGACTHQLASFRAVRMKSDL